MTDSLRDTFELGRRLRSNVLEPMKSVFVGKDEIIDLMGICLVAGENLFLYGPPGTAKSALVHELARRIEGRVYDYLLTRFTEPNEIFGPFDIGKLREGVLVTNTEGMIPEASFVFLDELLNANSAILNSLLSVLNERVFRRGREKIDVPTLMFVGASNRLPEDDTLRALFDRFPLRASCNNVAQEELQEVLAAGWTLSFGQIERADEFSEADIRTLQRVVAQVDLTQLRPVYVELIHRLRHAGISISDRRAVRLQRLIAASAILMSRARATESDLWVLRYIWDTEEQQEILAEIVRGFVNRSPADSDLTAHPRSQGEEQPNPEKLARDLARIHERTSETNLAEVDRSYLRDQLSLLAGRCQWVVDEQQRSHLEKSIEELWTKMGTTSD